MIRRIRELCKSGALSLSPPPHLGMRLIYCGHRKGSGEKAAMEMLIDYLKIYDGSIP